MTKDDATELDGAFLEQVRIIRHEPTVAHLYWNTPEAYIAKYLGIGYRQIINHFMNTHTK